MLKLQYVNHEYVVINGNETDFYSDLENAFMRLNYILLIRKMSERGHTCLDCGKYTHHDICWECAQ